MDRHAHIESLKELWLAEGDLPWLDTLDDDTLAALHAEVVAHAERVEQAQGSVYRTMANSTKFIPKFVVAKLAGNLDPYVVAQITRHLDSKTAAAVSKSLEPTFLGDVAVHLEAEKTAEIVKLTDLDTVTVVVERMSDRGLHHRLGELADALDPDVLNRLVNKLGDADRVASIAAEMTNYEKLMHVGRSLKPKLLERIVRVLQARGDAHAAETLAGARG